MFMFFVNIQLALCFVASQALESQLERLREELETEVHERNAADLIARNLEASNRGLQQRVVELERAAAASITAQSQPLQTASSYYFPNQFISVIETRKCST